MGKELPVALGIAGAAILFVGVFAPIISAPIVGNQNYFQNGEGDGIILIVLAAVAFALAVGRQFRILWVPGAGALSVLAYTYFNVRAGIADMRADLQTDLAGNPFAGFAEMAVQSIQLQWGWALLIIGAGLLIASSVVAAQDTPGRRRADSQLP